MKIMTAVSFAVFTGDADTNLCCVNRTNHFLVHISSLVPVLSIFFSVTHFCMFSWCLERNPLFGTWKLFSCLEQVHNKIYNRSCKISVWHIYIYLYTYIYTHTHTHTRIYIYIYIYIRMAHKHKMRQWDIRCDWWLTIDVFRSKKRSWITPVWVRPWVR